MLRCTLALILLAAGTLSSAQNPTNRDYQLTVDVQLVELPISVLDNHGLPVRGLRREHFTVFEDKLEQNISLFKQEDVPLSIGLVIDGSGSMMDKRDKVSTAAMTFVRESNPEDETAVFSFGDEAFLEQDFTSNTRKLSHALEGIASNGKTALYDAVFLATKHLRYNSDRDKKVLIVISDGEDNQSQYKLKQVLNTMRESNVILYAVGLLKPFSPPSIYGVSGKDALKKLAEATGGASFFPQNVSEVEEICRRIARDLRNQYTIGYRPSNEKLDGSWRKIQVRLNAPKSMSKLKVRTRQGYYAPRDTRSPSQQVAGESGQAQPLSKNTTR